MEEALGFKLLWTPCRLHWCVRNRCRWRGWREDRGVFAAERTLWVKTLRKVKTFGNFGQTDLGRREAREKTREMGRGPVIRAFEAVWGSRFILRAVESWFEAVDVMIKFVISDSFLWHFGGGASNPGGWETSRRWVWKARLWSRSWAGNEWGGQTWERWELEVVGPRLTDRLWEWRRWQSQGLWGVWADAGTGHWLWKQKGGAGFGRKIITSVWFSVGVRQPSCRWASGWAWCAKSLPRTLWLSNHLWLLQLYAPSYSPQKIWSLSMWCFRKRSALFLSGLSVFHVVPEFGKGLLFPF